METIDEGIEILTQLPAGERDESGRFPDGTFNQKVERRLLEFAEEVRAFHSGSSPQESPAEKFVSEAG
ncbi:MAG: hypothetical protein JO232_06525 [Verrucomicrobia bacterium]|nr:hypothetical protein [Verrucomicrobiota bacterium]